MAKKREEVELKKFNKQPAVKDKPTEKIKLSPKGEPKVELGKREKEKVARQAMKSGRADKTNYAKAKTAAIEKQKAQKLIKSETERVGSEEVTTNIVGKEEAFKTARDAGGKGVEAGAGITKDGQAVKAGDIARQLIPFNKERIGIHTDNQIFNTAAEYVLNNPYATAITLYGLGGLGKFAVGKLAGKIGTAGKLASAAAKGEAARSSLRETVKRIQFPELFNKGYAVNTKTAKMSVSMISKIAHFMKKPSFFVPAVLGAAGTYPWAEWSLGEAKEGMVFNANKVRDTKNPELINEFMEQQEEIYDINAWERIARLVPGANIAFGFSQKAKALQIQMKTNNSMLKNTLGKLNVESEKNSAEESQALIDEREEKISRGR